MKKLLAATVATFFAAGVSAHDVYSGLAKGNSELFDEHAPADRTTGVQPGVGDRFDRYNGLADGNSDLFKRGSWEGPSGERPDVYQGLSGNPDIQW